MADTARSKGDTKEIFDGADVLIRKVKKLADILRNSSHAIAFTGAGISTSAGIPDFRSGMNTCLATGPGKWEQQAHEKAIGKKMTRPPAARTHSVSTLRAYPTYTHMALKTLLERGVLKFLVSQNTDGLHRRSGVPAGMLAELHGNGNLETCGKCGQQYLRDFRTRNNQAVHKHENGRVCDDPKCLGKLRDTIINFGENLPEKELDAAESHAARADVCLALGSSLTVTPAANGPEAVGKKRHGDLFIMNLQPTPLDALATERLNGKCDDVLRLLMAELGIEVPPWRLQRGVTVEVRDAPSAKPSTKPSAKPRTAVDGPRNAAATSAATSAAARKKSLGILGSSAAATPAGTMAQAAATVAKLANGTIGKPPGPKPPTKQIVVNGFDPQTLLPFMLFESVTLLSSATGTSDPRVRNSHGGTVPPRVVVSGSTSSSGSNSSRTTSATSSSVERSAFGVSRPTSQMGLQKKVVKPPFVFNVDEADMQKMAQNKEPCLFVRLEFMKHYNEPPLVLPVGLKNSGGCLAAGGVSSSGADINISSSSGCINNNSNSKQVNDISVADISAGLRAASPSTKYEIELDFQRPSQWGVRELSAADMRARQAARLRGGNGIANPLRNPRDEQPNRQSESPNGGGASESGQRPQQAANFLDTLHAVAGMHASNFAAMDAVKALFQKGGGNGMNRGTNNDAGSNCDTASNYTFGTPVEFKPVALSPCDSVPLNSARRNESSSEDDEIAKRFPRAYSNLGRVSAGAEIDNMLVESLG